MAVDPRDRRMVAAELRRMPRDLTGIAARCPFGYPAVTETAPVLSGGEPNPTLLYLTCPELATIVSQVESAGGVRSLRALARADLPLRAMLDDITRAYRERRIALLEQITDPGGADARLGAGIGGPESPEVASCLHAYAAALLSVMSGWLVPEGEEVAKRTEAAWSKLFPALDVSWCPDCSCAKWDTELRRAAIDVGTISVRLLVADLTDGRPWTVVRKAVITRLGEGLAPGGLLAREARRRTGEAVARFCAEARARGAVDVILAGTSAVREASDGSEFLETLGRDNVLHSVVLEGEREAALGYRGATLDISDDPVVLDVGGGSTELTVRLESERVWPTSLKLGASRATGAWVVSDPPSPGEIAKIRKEAEREFGEVSFRYARDALLGVTLVDGEPPPSRRLVGVAGTITTLAALDAGLEVYDSEAIHLRTLTLESVRGLVARLSAMTTQERAALPCVQPGRAPVIVAGAVIVMAAMETLGYDVLTVSERDLLDGLVMDISC
jgi:exopolyphosphatase/guanosine-5'-triphosphate,3'-diphosphate pyrophosphatase